MIGFGSTLTVDWLNIDGKWVAKCDREPGWKFEADEYTEETKAAAQTSLKRFHSRGLRFQHWGGVPR